MGQRWGAVRRAKLRCGLAAKFREPSRVATGAFLSHTCLWSAPEMLDRMGEWATALDLTVSLPLWAVAGSVALIAFVCAVALRRGASDGRSVPVAVLVLLVALVGWWGARQPVRGPRCAAGATAIASALWGMCSRSGTAARRTRAPPSDGCVIPVGSPSTSRGGRSKLARRARRPAGAPPALAGSRAMR